MGVHWAYNASGELDMRDQIEIIDLRTLFPLDEDTIMTSVKKTGKCLVVTEEPIKQQFRISIGWKNSRAVFSIFRCACNDHW